MRDRFPRLYETVAPIARAARRRSALAEQAREAARFSAGLHGGSVRAVGDTNADPGGPRVVFDGAAFQDPHSGMARLWSAVFRQWAASGFAPFVTVLDRAGSAPRHKGFRYIETPPLRAHDAASQRSMLQAACDTESADLFVSSTYTHPESCRSLLYLYDMTPEVLGWDLSAPVWRDKHRAIQHASAFACLSANTAADLHRIYPDTASRPCAIALPGVAEEFKPSSAAEVASLSASLGLPEHYFVFLGHRDNYKNAPLVFDAVAGLAATSGWGLLLVGGRPELEPRFAEKAIGFPVRIARLSDSELQAAYTGAAALFYISRYEGFGLPVLEAMACDCPVITCRNSSLPEAAGDAALYVADDDPADLLAAMHRVIEADVRADLIARGRARSAMFSWQRTADIIERAIREAASS